MATRRYILETRINEGFRKDDVLTACIASVYERGVSALRLEEQELVLRRLNAQRREKRKMQYTRPREPKEGLLDMAERQALRKAL